MNFKDYLSSKRSGNSHIKINHIPTTSKIITNNESQKRPPSPPKIFSKSLKPDIPKQDPPPQSLFVIDSDNDDLGDVFSEPSQNRSHLTNLVKPSEVIQPSKKKEKSKKTESANKKPVKSTYKYYPKIPDNLRDIRQHNDHKPKGGSKVFGTKVVKKAVEPVQTGPLTGSTFVITGLLRGYERDELTEILRKYGGKVTGSVSKKTTCLIHGNKLEDGRHYSEDETQLEEMLLFLMGGKKPEVEQASSLATEPVQEQKFESLWTEKYRPKKLKDIVGNVQAVEKLVKWLEDWESVIYGGLRKDIRPVRGGRFDPQMNVNAIAALISGPPGVGKTTAARLVSLGLNYKITELNASDLRSKKAILEPLLSSSKSSCLTESAQVVRSILIMDEIDGMCAGDRGGIAALIQVVKQTRIPIICICNDRNTSKLKVVSNYSYDIRFNKPNKLQVTARMMEILHKEGIEAEPASVEQVVEASGCDVRQSLILLEMWARNHRVVTPSMAKFGLKVNSKDPLSMVNNFEAGGRLLSRKDTRPLRHKEKVDLFFIDFDFIPLIIYENYLLAMTNEPNQLKRMSLAADSISLGDIMSKFMRAEKEWTLLPQYAQVSAIEPGLRSGNGVAFPKFPEWFGRNSTQRKNERMLRDVRNVMAGYISGDTESVLKDYIPTLYKLIMSPLKQGKIEETVMTMNLYKINPEMLKENLIQLQFGANTYEEEFKNIPARDKKAVTKLYNSLFKSSIEKIKKKKEREFKDKIDHDIEDESEIPESESEESEIELRQIGGKKKRN